MAGKKKEENRLVEIRNKKASHKYFIGEKFEAGVKLQGTEVKSIRLGKAQIGEAFVRIEKGNAILYHAHIDEYKFGNENNHNPVRPRQLLLHKKEINKLRGAVEAGGKAIVPLRLYIKKGLVKLELAICDGKQLHDKRESLKKQDAMREAQRIVNHRR